MARDFEDFFLDDDDASLELEVDEDDIPGGVVFTEEEEVISLEDAVTIVGSLIEKAVNFINSEMILEWEEAEDFFNGESDVPKVDGRSKVTETSVRDAVRSLKPSIMRVFLQTPKIVEYSSWEPLNRQVSLIAAQQSIYVNSLFWQSGGYKSLLDVAHDASLKKAGILKSCYQKDAVPEYYRITHVTTEQLSQLQTMPNVTIVSVEPMENVPEGLEIYNVEVAKFNFEGKIALEHVPLHEFFVDDGATCPEDALVIGQRRDITVADARRMGLEYDGDWRDLTSHETELNEASGESAKRRGYVRSGLQTEKEASDPTQHKFLLTEAYSRFDLEGTGYDQLYRFYLGGIDYEYLSHERVDENPYSVAQIDPIPGAFFGRSVHDVLKDDQNVKTSLLRATCDNAHLANNRRLAVHETLVNMEDVLNPKVGAPIRVRQPGMIQEIGVESSLPHMLPLLQYLDLKTDNKVGVTDAALGLDPDALQSTDKDAVQNTIQLAQGQVELMVRNLAETGIAPAMRKLLKLSIHHNPRMQTIEISGAHVPVDQLFFNPNAVVKTNVGLGTHRFEDKMMGLQRIAEKQEQIITNYGLSNPICGLEMIFNTMTDMAELLGIPNLGRYFNQITPDVSKQLDQMMAQKQKEAQGEPPSAAITAAETIRAQASMQKQAMENQQKTQDKDASIRQRMIELFMEDDRLRDDMAQRLAIEEAKITGQGIDKAFVIAQQNADREYQEAMERLRLEHENKKAQLMAQRSNSPVTKG